MAWPSICIGICLVTATGMFGLRYVNELRGKFVERNVSRAAQAAILLDDFGGLEALLTSGIKPNIRIDHAYRMQPDGSLARAMAPHVEFCIRPSGDTKAVRLQTIGEIVRAMRPRNSMPMTIDATIAGRDKMVRRMIDAGYPIDEQDSYGQTILMFAAWSGRSELVAELLRRGARIDLRDEDGRTAMEWAQLRHHKRIASLLKRHMPRP